MEGWRDVGVECTGRKERTAPTYMQATYCWGPVHHRRHEEPFRGSVVMGLQKLLLVWQMGAISQELHLAGFSCTGYCTRPTIVN